MDALNFLKSRLAPAEFEKIAALKNDNFTIFLNGYISLLNPEKVLVYSGKPEEAEAIRRAALDKGEEVALAVQGHTLHFDGEKDLARAREQTKFLIPAGMKFDPNLAYIDRERGLKEVRDLLKNSMSGRTMYILFFCLGPNNSLFSVPAVQLTDSAYVAHSEILLYRSGYGDFRSMKEKNRFFKAVHGSGELTAKGVSKNTEERRIYIDLTDNTTLSVNTQYGGNTLGMKKLAMRLAISLGSKEGWLCEHMFLMAVHGPQKRKTYLAGAFPSACGKTSTAMLPQEKIVGDDILFLRIRNHRVFGANTERGIFGIIENVNPDDDPVISRAITGPNEVIFSNVLLKEDRTVYWNGSKKEEPETGINYGGTWRRGKKDENGISVPASHKNARFTLGLGILPNVDENLDNPEGCEIHGLIYGGRDSDTSVPVEEAFSWEHGIVTKGAALESETTAATLGGEGRREFNPMSNMDFLSIPVGRYIDNNLKFGKQAAVPPRIFSVNYFLKDASGKFLTDRADKSVWLKWMELRCHGEGRAIKTPTGTIPDYDTLKGLFKTILNREYAAEIYKRQFTIRISANIAKIDRIAEIYRYRIPEAPELLFEILDEQKERLEIFKSKYGETVSPFDLE